MAKVKYDVSGDIPETGNAPVGTYRAKIQSAEAKESGQGNPMVVIALQLTHHADGKKVTEDYWPVRQYLMVADDRPYALRTIKEFMIAIGAKPKGELDTDKIVGKQVTVRLKSDTDQDGEYQPRVGKITPLAKVEDDEPDEDEPEPDEDDEDDEEEGEEDENVDLSELDRKELKQLIKEEELDIAVKKSMSDDDLRSAIEEALGASDDDEDEEDEEDEEEPDDDEEEGEDNDEAADYDSMSVADLKAELKERELATNGAKAVLIKRLKKDDESDSF